jgi:hypothetical protein
MVLVLAVVFVTTAGSSPASLAQTNRTAPVAQTTHGARKKTQHMTPRSAGRTTAHSVVHAAGHRAGRTVGSPANGAVGRGTGQSGARKRETGGRTNTARLKERSRSHQASAPKTPAGETKTPTRDAKIPAGETRNPTRQAKIPAGEAKISAGETRNPTREAKIPAGEAKIPAGEARNPTIEAEVPAKEAKKPAGAAKTPAGAARIPASAARVPATEAKIPVREPEIASSESEIPAQESKAPRRRAVTKAASLNRTRTAMPPPLKGSYGSLERQNERSEADNLERIEDEEDLADRIARKFLVPVPASAALGVNENLPEHHRYCRPWTARFLADLARVHEAQFHRPLEVSSAVRTVEYQKRLMETNGNAAAAEGDIVSPHLTGATIDIAKNWMSRQEIGWMRSWLLPLQNAGKIDVEEEFQQACFHITVYKSYVPAKPVGKAGQRKPGQAGSGPGKARQSKAGATGEMASLGR